AVAAVRVERQAGDRLIDAVGQNRPVIDGAVVCRVSTGNGGVLVARFGVGNRHRRVVGPGLRDRQRRARARPVLVGDRVVRHHVGGRALRQVLVGGIAGVKAVAAIGVGWEERRGGKECGAECVLVVDVVLVGSYVS